MKKKIIKKEKQPKHRKNIEKMFKKTRNDVIEDLVSAFNEVNDVYDIARTGFYQFEGYENMNDKTLKEHYENHFRQEIKIVE